MESIVNSLLNFGIGGAMAGAVLYFLWHMLTKTIPAIVERQRDDLKAVQATFVDALARMDARADAANAAVCTRLESLDRHTKANQENIIQLQRVILSRLWPNLLPTDAKPTAPEAPR